MDHQVLLVLVESISAQMLCLFLSAYFPAFSNSDVLIYIIQYTVYIFCMKITSTLTISHDLL